MYSPRVAKAQSNPGFGRSKKLTGNRTTEQANTTASGPAPPQAPTGGQVALHAAPGHLAGGVSRDFRDIPVAPPFSSKPPSLLEPSLLQQMQAGFGFDFSRVRIETGREAADLTRRFGAAAYTSGETIGFAPGRFEPSTAKGRLLIAHELAHVVQQSKGSRTAGTPRPAVHDPMEREADYAAEAVAFGRQASVSAVSTHGIQFKIEPEDAAPEMVGRTFEVITAFTSGTNTLAPGDQVKISQWDVDAIHSVKVAVLSGAAAGTTLTIPQKIIKPVRTAAAGVAPYSAGVEAQTKRVEKAEADLAKFQATKPQFKTKKQQAAFAKEETRQQGLLTKRRDLLNREEIQETMFNSFDTIIANEVKAANTAHGLTGGDALDPNLVKAQLFEESELGTAGEHMSVPPTHPVKTRFNLGQVIDSSATALLTLMEKEQQPLIAKFKLTDLRKDLSAAQTEKSALEKNKKRTPAEDARLQQLKNLSHQNWETFIWQYKAPGQTQGFNDAVNELFASGGSTPKNLDYQFWIHLAVLWLFEKKKSGMTWEQAIKAYNGSGARAEHYRAAIAKRSTDAVASQKAGTEFIPSH
jgi:hypothetical protein